MGTHIEKLSLSSESREAIIEIVTFIKNIPRHYVKLEGKESRVA